MVSYGYGLILLWVMLGPVRGADLPLRSRYRSSRAWRIPGARIMSIDEIEARHEEVGLDQDIVLYFT